MEHGIVKHGEDLWEALGSHCSQVGISYNQDGQDFGGCEVSTQPQSCKTCRVVIGLPWIKWFKKPQRWLLVNHGLASKNLSWWLLVNHKPLSKKPQELFLVLKKPWHFWHQGTERKVAPKKKKKALLASRDWEKSGPRRSGGQEVCLGEDHAGSDKLGELGTSEGLIQARSQWRNSSFLNRNQRTAEWFSPGKNTSFHSRMDNDKCVSLMSLMT